MKKLSITFMLLLTFTFLSLTSCKEEDSFSQINFMEDNLDKSKKIIKKSKHLEGKTILWEDSFYSYKKDEENWILNVPIPQTKSNEIEKIVIYSSKEDLEIVLWSYKSDETLNVKLTFKNHDIFREFIGEISSLDLNTGSVNKLNYFKGNIVNTNTTTLAKFGGGVCGRCHNGMGDEDNPIELDPVIVIPADPWLVPDLIPPFIPGVPVTVPSINEALKNKPFAFIDVPCDIIKDWLKTARHQAAKAQLDKLNNIVRRVTATTPYGSSITKETVANLQNINNAYSKVVNLDYFPVTINQLPVVNGTRLTPEQFLNQIRTNINSFVDTSYSVFKPYNWYGINDIKLWNSSNPLGAVIGIDIKGPDNGSVIVTDYSSSGWTFSTISDPRYGAHPVSGHRDFGFTQNPNGSYTFFTRGVDRLTGWEGYYLQKYSGFPFEQADALWKSFQNKISNYVNSHQGKANVGTSKIERPDWQKVKDVLDGKKPLSTLSKDCK